VKTRRWIAIGAVTAVVAAIAVAATALGAQQSAREERLAAAKADFSAFTAAVADWEAAQDDYASLVLTAAAESPVLTSLSAEVHAAAAFDAGAVAAFNLAAAELSNITPTSPEGQDPAQWAKSVQEDPVATLGLEQPTLPALTEQEAADAYAAGEDAFRTARASLTDGVTDLAAAAKKTTTSREELAAARQRVFDAGLALSAAATLVPETVLPEFDLATDDSKATFVAAHGALAALGTDADVQGLYDAVTRYLESYEALRTSNEEAVAEMERIRREQVGTVTVLTDFMYYLPYDQCIQAPGVAYTQTFDISGGQNHTTSPDPAQDFDIWTYSISGGTVSYFRCYAD
jgi:hypothetical protein